VTYNGAFLDLTGTTHGILVKQGSGTLDIGGASTYTGATSINNGTIQLTTGNNRLPAGTILNIGQSASSNLGTLDLHGLNQQIAGLTSTPGTNSSASTNTITSTSTAATLTINGTGSYSYGTNSAANSGVIMGPVSLVMEGGGTETLGGSNSYTGSTTVSGATLIVSGSLTSTSSVSVSSGTLELSASNAIANSAPLTLSTGVLLDATNNKATFASLTTSGASTLDLGVSSTASILNFGDSHGIAWSGTLTIANWNGTTTSGGPDEVFFGSSAGGLTSTQLGDIAFLNPTINGVAKTGDYNANILSTGQIVAVVPEPATWAAMLSGLAALVLIECRRSRRRGAPMPDSRRPKQLGRLRSNRL
jgi:autotransporter-associated beta strand protein